VGCFHYFKKEGFYPYPAPSPTTSHPPLHTYIPLCIAFVNQQQRAKFHWNQGGRVWLHGTDHSESSIDSEPEGKKQQTWGSRDCSYIVWLHYQKWWKKKKKEAEKQNPRQKVGGDKGQFQLSVSRLGSTSFWLSRKAKKSKNRAGSAWKQPRGNGVWNNWAVGQLWRALMCETPIKSFAQMVTKHFTFKYGSQFVPHILYWLSSLSSLTLRAPSVCFLGSTPK